MELFSNPKEGNGPIYTPVLRARQEEIKVLKYFDFGSYIFPLMEIIKPFDRKNNKKPFNEIYGKIIEKVSAPNVFIDLPLYLNERRSMKAETLEFVLSVISNWEKRTDHILSLSDYREKLIPVISSYLPYSEFSFLEEQVAALRPVYKSLCIRVSYKNFLSEIEIIESLLNKNDFLIVDFEHINSLPSGPALREITERLKEFDKCHKIVIRSAINNDVTNKDLENNEVVYGADNHILDLYQDYGGDSFGDYAGIKKDALTEGGTISPGFIFFDGTKNQYFGFKYVNKRELEAFKNDIVPAVLRSDAAQRMENSEIDFLSESNEGWNSLNRIYDGRESGKNQAKFKGISMMHYLHCLKIRIEGNPENPFQFES